MAFTTIIPANKRAPSQVLFQLTYKPKYPLNRSIELVGRISPKTYFIDPAMVERALMADTTVVFKENYGKIGRTTPGAPYFETGLQIMITDLSGDRLKYPTIGHMPFDRARQIVEVSSQNQQFYKSTFLAEQELNPNQRRFPANPCFYWGMNIGPCFFGSLEQILTEGRQSNPSVHPHSGVYADEPSKYKNLNEVSNGARPSFLNYKYGEAIGRILHKRMRQMFLDAGNELSEIDELIVKSIIHPKGLTARFQQQESIASLMERTDVLTKFLTGTTNVLNQLIADIHQSFYPDYKPAYYLSELAQINARNPMSEDKWQEMNGVFKGVTLSQAEKNLKKLGLGELFKYLQNPYELRLLYEKEGSLPENWQPDRGDPLMLKVGSGVLIFKESFERQTNSWVTKLRLGLSLLSGHKPFIETGLGIDMERKLCDSGNSFIGIAEQNRNSSAQSELVWGIDKKYINNQNITPTGHYVLQHYKPLPVYTNDLILAS